MAFPSLPNHPSLEVTGPTVKKMPYGILSVAEVIDLPAGPWMQGLHYPTQGCAGNSYVWPGPCNSLGEPHDPPLSVTVTVTWSYGPAYTFGGSTRYPVLAKVVTNPATGVPSTLVAEGLIPGVPWAQIPVNSKDPVRVGDIAGDRDFPITMRLRLSGAGIPAGTVAATDLPAPPGGTSSASAVFVVSDTGGSKTRDGGPVWVEADVFTIYGTAECQPGAGFKDVAADLALSRLDSLEGQAIERRLWEVWGKLAGRKAQQDVPANATVMDGLRRLEALMTDCLGGVGTLHVPRSLAWCLKCARAIEKDGGRYVSPLDTPISFGLGYAESLGPEGVPVPAGQMAVYATGPVVIRRSPVIQHEVLDQWTNKYLAVAERVYAVTWDCCLKSGVISQCGGCDCP
ncbi:hypothetical protein ACFC1T_09575 [Kitasatospora sp. NPDC056076]|uniref:hypothetical protein n=1 Tax=Kitasatospora sp. NPDC056076 TaxID=3345703 RepID=UPI0035DB12FE